MRPIPILFTALMLTACARSEPAATDQVEDTASSAQRVPETDAALADDPITPGSWEASAQGEAQAVLYRGDKGEQLFNIGCDMRGGLVVQRPGLVARGNLALMQMRTADVVRRVAVNAASGPRPQVEARVPYNDQLIAALLTFDEPLEVRYEGGETVVLPPSSTVSDLVRTCQQSNASGNGQPGATNDAAPAASAPAAEPPQAQ